MDHVKTLIFTVAANSANAALTASGASRINLLSVADGEPNCSLEVQKLRCRVYAVRDAGRAGGSGTAAGESTLTQLRPQSLRNTPVSVSTTTADKAAPQMT